MARSQVIRLTVAVDVAREHEVVPGVVCGLGRIATRLRRSPSPPSVAQHSRIPNIARRDTPASRMSTSVYVGNGLDVVVHAVNTWVRDQWRKAAVETSGIAQAAGDRVGAQSGRRCA